MGRAVALALVLAVAALAHVSAQSPQNAKPFLATQYATVRPAFHCTPFCLALAQLVLAKDPWGELCGMMCGCVYAMELAWRRYYGNPCTSGLGHCNLRSCQSLLQPGCAAHKQDISATSKASISALD